MRGGEYKCRIFKMHLKLRDQQLKAIHIDCYTKNLMVTTPKIYNKSIINKSTINLHTQKKKKQCKQNTKDSHQITREETNRGKEERRPTRTNPKQLTK